ncbi:MAG TPA: alpha/beta fold hydrolase, partial [Acidimicrobiales bacterium]
QCAPSKGAEGGPLGELGAFPAAVLMSHVVVATDYEGLGTPGVHTYAVGLAEGRNVLDSIRAAQRLTEAGTTEQSKSVAWGHSQGGGASLLTAELAATYAPDANLQGAVAGAPASELKLLATALRTSPFFGYLFMASAGFHAAYPEIDLTTVLAPAGVQATELAGTQCASDTVKAFAGKDASAYIKADPGSTEPFATILEENSPGVRKAAVPVFIYHGEADEQIPVVASKLVLDRYCANGSTALRKTYPDKTHVSVIPAAQAEITQYLLDRLAGKPAPTSC